MNAPHEPGPVSTGERIEGRLSCSVPRAIQVPAAWAPYQNGYWTEVGAWGPTWVDFAPWGYAPFRYGRWVFVGSRWGWCPGAYVARPVWAPAMVGWIGGAGWGLSLNAGGPVYGWMPLGTCASALRLCPAL